VLSAAGHKTVTKTVDTTSATITGAAHATRYTVAVYAATRYGTSVAAMTTVAVA
jgi:hypothetical protein